MDRVEYEKVIIQDIINQNEKFELNINPWYQRRSVWTTPQKAYLLNTIFEQKPVPSIYIRHTLDIDENKSIREVVDGQQRIRAIIEYVEGKFPARHPNYKKPILYSQLKRNEIEKFRLTSVSVGYLLGATDEDVIEIFGRLNSVAKSLNAQEKRNAQFSGEFKQFCLSQSSSRLAIWRDYGIFTANDISRMNEYLFMSDLIINILDGLSDYSSSNIDKYYKKYEETFGLADEISKKLDFIFSIIASIQPAVFNDTVFSRQPIFFSLCLAINSSTVKISPENVLKAILEIDQAFNSDKMQLKKNDLEFIAACTSSTQRIKARIIRNAYITNLIAR